MEAKEHEQLGVIEVLIIFGLAMFFAYFFLLMIGYPGIFPVGESAFVQRMTQLLVLLGVIAGAIFAMKHPRDFEEVAYRPAKTVAWGIVGCLPPVFLMLESSGVVVPVPVIGVVSLLAGFGGGYFLTGWEDLSSRGRIKDVLLSIGTAMIAGIALLLVITLFMQPMAQGAMGVLLMLANAGFFYGVSTRRDQETDGSKPKKRKKDKQAEEADKEDEDDSRTFNLKLSALLLVVNIPLGYLLPMLYELGIFLYYVTIGLAIVGMVLFVVILRASKKELTFVGLLRMGVGATAVALLVGGISVDFIIATCVILFVTWMILRLAHACTLIKLTRVQKVAPVYLLVRGKLPGYLGFVIGFVVNNVVFMTFMNDSALATGGLVVVGVLIVCSLALFPFSENYDNQLAVVPVVIDKTMATAEDIEKAKCAELAKRYNLSPREEEILFYIVRGRNARYIAEKLVISESTAKTHIHNIYKKSGIHSQQKFIDIMDELV